MSSHRLAKFFLSLPFRLTTVTSSGRRTAPYRLSGSRAAAPFASTASTERSIGIVSFAAGGLGLGAGLVGVGVAGRCRAAGGAVARPPGGWGGGRARGGRGEKNRGRGPPPPPPRRPE